MSALQSLQPFHSTAAGVADLLNWAVYMDDGMVQGKDGSLLVAWMIRCPDTASATASELNYLTYQVNVALSRLDSRCAVWVDSVRLPVASYPESHRSHFPHPIPALIDAERAEQFQTAGDYYDGYKVLCLSYLPPLVSDSRVGNLMYKQEGEADKAADRQMAYFKKIIQNLEDSLSAVIELRRMGAYTFTDRFGRPHLRDELVNYLHFALTGLNHPINIPPVPMFMSGYIGGQELWVGNIPKIGENFCVCVAFDGFPFESYPNILAVLDNLPIAYRWSVRMLFLDQHESVTELNRYRRKWRQKARGFFSQVFKTSGGQVNEDAVLMAAQTDEAITDANSDLVRFGYFTPVITLMGPDQQALEENARIIIRELQHAGFAARMETLNTIEAWLGSLPGHCQPNVRRSLVHTLNLADLLPLSSIWAGDEVCPNPMYPKESPPLLVAASTGATPFFLNLHISDVGHTLIFGPTGAGKSTLLAFLIAQFMRYSEASIFAFDKGNSLWALANAAGGRHYDIGAENSPHFTPLGALEDPSDLLWAAEWVAAAYELQTGKSPTPRQKEGIHKALTLFRDNGEPEHRSLTDFVSTVQDQDLRSALAFYTVDGALGELLDSPTDGLRASLFTVLEIEELMGMGEKVAIPVLMYLFRRFEKSLKGQPALLVLDEAWVMLGHPVFREKIREWLKVLRKNNCAVVMATQSLSDAVKSGIFDVLVESCPTRILLPNEEADKGGTEQHMGPRDLYTIMGMNETEVQILKNAVKKRQYYYTSPKGKRLFDLCLGPVALSFVGVSDKKTLTHLKQLKATLGDQWPYAWLKEREVEYEHLAG